MSETLAVARRAHDQDSLCRKGISLVRVCPKCGLPRKKVKLRILGSATRSPDMAQDDWTLEQRGFAGQQFRTSSSGPAERWQDGDVSYCFAPKYGFALKATSQKK
jgi:hypothetical protein